MIDEKHLKEKPKHVLKPDLANALFPLLLRSLLHALFIGAGVFAVLYVLRLFNVLTMSTQMIIASAIGIWIGMAIAPLVWRFIVLSNTTYYIYADRALREYSFVSVKRKMIPFSHVVDISTQISMWDRLCGAGDITLDTPDDSSSLTLEFVKDPREVEILLTHMISRQKSSQQAEHPGHALSKH